LSTTDIQINRTSKCAIDTRLITHLGGLYYGGDYRFDLQDSRW